MEMRTFLWTGYVTVTGRGRLRPALAAALDADGVEPDVGEPGAWQVALLQPGDCVVGRGAHPAT